MGWSRKNEAFLWSRNEFVPDIWIRSYGLQKLNVEKVWNFSSQMVQTSWRHLHLLQNYSHLCATECIKYAYFLWLNLMNITKDAYFVWNMDKMRGIFSFIVCMKTLHNRIDQINSQLVWFYKNMPLASNYVVWSPNLRKSYPITLSCSNWT